MTSPFYVGQKLRASPLAALANEDNFDSIGGCSLSTTSGTYVDITGATKSFTKVTASSDLIVQISLSCYVTIANTVVKISVNVNSTDNDATQMPINAANAHSALPTGTVRITGLAAGTYTIKARALRVSGTGTVTIDANDTISMLIQEKPI